MTTISITATGVPATDYAAIVAAIFNASDGYTIELKNGAAGEEFCLGTHHSAWAPAWEPSTAYAPYTGLASAFPSYGVATVRRNGNYAYFCTVAGTSASSGGPGCDGDDIVDGTCHWRRLGPVAFHRIAVTKSLTFQGVTVDGNKPVINGGFQTFQVLAPGKNVSFIDLHFKNWNMFPIYVGRVADLVVRGCKMEHKDMRGLSYRVSGEYQGVGIVAGTSSYVNGITGNVLIEDNYIDLHTTTDLNNTDKTNLMTFGIAMNVSAPGASIRCKNNVVRGVTQNGLMIVDPWGSVECQDNEIHMASWVHYRAADEYHADAIIAGRALQIGSGSYRSSNTDHNGSATLSKNVVFTSQPDGTGLLIYNLISDKWGPISTVGNTFVFGGDHIIKTGMSLFGYDYCYIGQNKFIGKVQYGILLGSLASPGYEFGTKHNGFNGNNIQQLDCLDEDGEKIALYFTEDAWYNSLAGGGYSPETVKFPVDENDAPLTQGNQVTGYAPIHGGLGTALSTVIQAFRNAPPYSETGFPDVEEPA